MREGVMDFDVYEGDTRYLGLASVALPDVVQKVLTVSGAGTGGDFELPTGRIDPMTATINFRSANHYQHSITTMKQHKLTLRVAHIEHNRSTGAIGAVSTKYVLVVMPKKITLGEVTPGAAQPVSGEFAVHRLEVYYSDKLALKIDPVNGIYKDYSTSSLLAKFNKILGRT